MTARDYQTWAVDQTWEYFRKQTGNPIIAMPTGTGKSHVIADLCKGIMQSYPSTRLMMLTHVKELIQQNFAKFIGGWPTAPAGIYSAGLNKRESNQPITFAGIASVARKPGLFGHIDLLFIDECDLVSPTEFTMYNKFINALKLRNPNLKVIGLTATPWRAGLGHITNGGLFTDVCVDMTGVDAFNWFISEGYLVPLIPKPTALELDITGVHMRGDDYIQSELQIAVDKPAITRCALEETLKVGHDRQCWLVFASGVDHAKHIAEELCLMGVPAKAVYSGMADDDRQAALADLASGRLRALVNNNILTTGYDNVRIDMIVMLRPTGSSRLWVQMLGRGTRPYYMPGYDLSTKEGRLQAIMESPKQNCLVLDFAANIKKLGPINDPVLPRKKGEKAGPAPIKLCHDCDTYNHASARYCINCGKEFVFVTKLKITAGTQELIKAGKGPALPTIECFKVDHITYNIHNKVGAPPMLKATYYCGVKNYTDYVCIQHTNDYAKRKAREWWAKRSGEPFPDTTDGALDLITTLKSPTHIKVWMDNPASKYPSIVGYCFDGSAFGTISVADALTSKPPEVSATKERGANTVDLDKLWNKVAGMFQPKAPVEPDRDELENW